MDLYDYVKAHDSYGASFAGWHPVSSGGPARFAACQANQQGWGAATVREYLLRARNSVFMVPNIPPMERDQEMVRFAVAFYVLKQQDAALGTLQAINDPNLRSKWLQILSGANPDTVLPVDDIANAFWSKNIISSPSDLRFEISTLMCLDQRLALFELHKIGREGTDFPNCYLDQGQSTKRNGHDFELPACVDAVTKNPYGNAVADYAVLDGMLSIADTLSDGLYLVR